MAPSTSGYADRHRVQMYVSITNTEGVTTILMILALKVILLDRLQGINCSGIQEP